MKTIKDISVSEFNTLSWLSFKFGFDMTDLDEYSKDIEISNSDAGDLKELIKSTLEEGVDKVNREKNLKSLFKKIGAVDNFIDIGINGRDFKLYIARSDEDKSKGLEVISSLAADEGMYFPFDGNQYVTFHMGKVQFPIDIVFLSDFEITKIIKNAQPGSTDRWSAMADTVIELSGGICDEYNINEGNVIKKESKMRHLRRAIDDETNGVEILTWFSDPYDIDGIDDIYWLAKQANKPGARVTFINCDAFERGESIVVYTGPETADDVLCKMVHEELD